MKVSHSPAKIINDLSNKFSEYKQLKLDKKYEKSNKNFFDRKGNDTLKVAMIVND